ncbi:IS66 family insertion sequence element accessory protein TnpB [[Ruminococcus] torques]|uniref:IS66 family insertion sequence element accessory protein TnpB n=1 Tax=[Ruminococcus] torques TaxID=33039 RepID=UPI0025A3D0A6|nr:IS66 family insertion sequence element accessory protein TnpB [[Ruminococcus] torques]MDM8236358.1 IS66 family insertion sequence element accessory protein TnpB [[Ruminococcus] torques]
MDQCTHEVRTEYWGNIIKACGQRPAGQSAKKWMDGNEICEQSYYHWQRRFRQQAYDQMKEKEMLPSVAEKAEVSFAEIPYSPAIGRGDIPGVSEAGRTPAAVIRTSAMSIEISNQISESLLSMILREVSNA